MQIMIGQAEANDSPVLAVLVSELHDEMVSKIAGNAHRFSLLDTLKRAQNFMEQGVYFVFLAREATRGTEIGFIALYENLARYTEPFSGTIPEFYVRHDYRSFGIGTRLLEEAKRFALLKGWARLEVATPAILEYERILRFYQRHGFSLQGGRKLTIDF